MHLYNATSIFKAIVPTSHQIIFEASAYMYTSTWSSHWQVMPTSFDWGSRAVVFGNCHKHAPPLDTRSYTYTVVSVSLVTSYAAHAMMESWGQKQNARFELVALATLSGGTFRSARKRRETHHTWGVGGEEGGGGRRREEGGGRLESVSRALPERCGGRMPPYPWLDARTCCI